MGIEYFLVGFGFVSAIAALLGLAIYGRSVRVNRRMPPPDTFE